MQPPPGPRPLPFRPLQALLLAGTFVCMAYSGGTYWDTARHLLDDPGTYGLLPATPSDFGLRCVAGLPFALWLFAILGAHEMGHYVACRRYRISATWPWFIPAPLFLLGTFGAVIRIRSAIPHRRALFDVAFAGPAAGFVVAVAALAVGVHGADSVPADFDSLDGGYVYSLPWVGAWVTGLLRHGQVLTMNGTLAAAWAGFLITVLNLFPAGQLDGGHLTYAVSRSVHRWFSRAAIALCATTVFFAFRAGYPAVYLIWLGVLLWMRDRHPRLWDEQEPLGTGRTLLAIVAFLIFALSFTWAPLRLLD
jgi:membrane-associated protease RseP (regulator of RpoE activity)